MRLKHTSRQSCSVHGAFKNKVWPFMAERVIPLKELRWSRTAGLSAEDLFAAALQSNGRTARVRAIPQRGMRARHEDLHPAFGKALPRCGEISMRFDRRGGRGAGALSLAISEPALAANECGPLSAAASPALQPRHPLVNNLYPGGISYLQTTLATDLHVNLDSDVNVIFSGAQLGGGNCRQ